MSKVLLTYVWPILAGVISGLLVVGGQACFREVDKGRQQEETKRYVDRLEQIVSRNPIRVHPVQVPDDIPGVQPTTKVVEDTQETTRPPIFVYVNWAPGGEIEGYLTTELIENAREEGRLASLRRMLDRLSIHVGARTALISEDDRFALDLIILDMQEEVSKLEGVRAFVAKGTEDHHAVGLAEPLASIFFDRLRDTIDWLQD